MKFGFLTKNVDHGEFASRTAVVATIAAATVATTFVLWKLMDLFPMVFATILVALAWRGGGQRVAARLGLSQGLGARRRRAYPGCFRCPWPVPVRRPTRAPI